MRNQPIVLWSEEDVKNKLIIPYFETRDFDVKEMKFESPVRIFISGRQRTLRSDIIVSILNEPILLIETKKPNRKLREDDKEQAIGYARLHDEIIPFAMVTNGTETWILDVINKKRIEKLHSFKWVSDKRAKINISQELRYEALKSLIVMDYENLLIFCQSQMDLRMRHIKGNIINKKYDPEIYVRRAELDERFDRFLKHSEKTCFSIIGEAGTGKTCAICHLADKYREENPSIFYDAYYLGDSLAETIHEDFVWAFKRDEHIATLVDRIHDIMKNHNKILLIFVDALNEFPHVEALKRELANFADKIKNKNIKICITCRTQDWEDFIENRGEFSPLIENIYIPMDNVTDLPGTHSFSLSHFSEDELSEGWEKYKAAFNLRAELTSKTRKTCKNPFIMRLVAETYRDKKTRFRLSKIRRREILDNYWKFKLRRTGNQEISEEILFTVGKMLFDLKAMEVPEYKIYEQIASKESFLEIYRALRSEVIFITRQDNFGNKWARFYYDFFMEYVIARFLFFRECVKQDENILGYVERLSQSLSSYSSAWGILTFLVSFHENPSGVIRRIMVHTDICSLLVKLPPEELVKMDAYLLKEIQARLNEELRTQKIRKVLHHVSSNCEAVEKLVPGLKSSLERMTLLKLVKIYSEVHSGGCHDCANKEILPILVSKLSRKRSLRKACSAFNKIMSIGGVHIFESLTEVIKPKFKEEELWFENIENIGRSIKSIGYCLMYSLRIQKKEVTKRLLEVVDQNSLRKKFESESNVMKKGRCVYRISKVSKEMADMLDPDGSFRNLYLDEQLKKDYPIIRKCLTFILEDSPDGLTMDQIKSKLSVNYWVLRSSLERMVDKGVVKKEGKIYKLNE